MNFFFFFFSILIRTFTRYIFLFLPIRIKISSRVHIFYNQFPGLGFCGFCFINFSVDSVTKTVFSRVFCFCSGCVTVFSFKFSKLELISIDFSTESSSFSNFFSSDLVNTFSDSSFIISKLDDLDLTIEFDLCTFSAELSKSESTLFPSFKLSKIKS